jgi:hypothetical protein
MAIILPFPRPAGPRDACAPDTDAAAHGTGAEIFIFTGSRAKAAAPKRARGSRPFFPALFPLLMFPLMAAPLEEA